MRIVLILPILNNSIKSIAGEGPQSGVCCVVVASFKSCSCTMGHLGRVIRMTMMRTMMMTMTTMMMMVRLNLGWVSGQGHKGEVLPLLWEVGVADRESQYLKTKYFRFRFF